MKTVQFNVFKFNELSKTAQSKAINSYKEYRSWSMERGWITEQFIDRLREMGITANVAWNLSHTKQDFINFDGAVTDIEKFNDELRRQGIGMVSNTANINFDNLVWKRESMYVSLSDSDKDYDTSNDRDRVESLVDIITEELAMVGYSQLEYYDSDEFISEMIVNNDPDDQYYLANGEEITVELSDIINSQEFVQVTIPAKH